MVWVLLNSEGNRIRELNGEVTPAFDYPSQALNYAESRGMKYYEVKQV